MRRARAPAGFLPGAVAFCARYGTLDWYKRLRPHRTLGRKPPLSRLAEMNVFGTNA